jgi:hypothetical protein
LSSAATAALAKERRNDRGEGRWPFKEWQMAAVAHDLDSGRRRKRPCEGPDRVGRRVAILFAGDSEARHPIERRQLACGPRRERAGRVGVGGGILAGKQLREARGQLWTFRLRSP